MTQSTFTEESPLRQGFVPRRRVVAVWSGAVLAASFATAVLFGARPGINLALSLFVVAVLAGVLAGVARTRGEPAPSATDVAAVILAGAVGVTADNRTVALVLLAIFWLCALAVLQRTRKAFGQTNIVPLLLAPLSALGVVLQQVAGLVGEALCAVRGGRYRSALRGAAWALPTVALFFLLLAQADPTLASWRTWALLVLQNVAVLPRIAFWVVLMVLLLGAFALAAWPRPEVSEALQREIGRPALRTPTERSIVLGSVVLLFALFFALRLAALFGDPGSRVGSGMTYAQAVHRGFGELTGVVTLTALLIVVLDGGARRGVGEARVRVLSWVLLAECLLLLASAWLRLLAYEEAYGYSMLRVYVHFYVLLVAVGLLLLAREAAGPVDPHRLFRRGFVAALLVVTLIAYANVPGWVVERNVERYQHGSTLDLKYLVGAGPDALPTIESFLPVLRNEDRVAVRCGLIAHFASKRSILLGSERWYEWNLRRRAAREVLDRLGPGADSCLTVQ